MTRYCLDSNPKTIRRIFDWDGKCMEFELCKNHLEDPDFSGHVKEVKLQ